MTIRKLLVTEGVYYLEIPAAGLNLLCGSPADSVKHLFRRGLIQQVDRNGIQFENGPNAILLSDDSIQNGHLSNLTEFPILQMLYRQGMLLPNHPNNTGSRPRLIGAPEQLAAQLRYIHRGNYGLISADEMIHAGIGADEAGELMRTKLHFAFGRIVRPDQFVECIELRDAPADLAEGVSVERLAHNVFEVRYGDDAVEVDLNLPDRAGYACPYPLSHVAIDRHYFAVVHTGDGDGWDFNRPAVGSVLIYQGKVYLVDAGPNIQHSLDALGIGIREVAGLFHTHCHDDHFAGLATLIQRDQPLQYFATPLVRASVTKKFCALLSIPEWEFAHYFDVHDLRNDEWNDIAGLEVRPRISPHPVETTIFNFRVLWEGGYRSYTHLADIASFGVLDRMTNPDPASPGMQPEAVKRIKALYLEPATVKKIDIGGGLIHGNADDFATDASPRLLLAHTSRDLTESERKIGSGAPFGTLDVMIPGEQNFPVREASEFLRRYFPSVPMERLLLLLNNPITSFNPQTIIAQSGRVPEYVYLLLGGNVEVLTPDPANRHTLYAGSLLAEAAALNQRPGTETYRSIGFVQALRLSADLYRSFVERHVSSAGIITVRAVEEKLRGTLLFSDAVTNLVLNALAKECIVTVLSAGERFSPHPEHLHLVAAGRLSAGEHETAHVHGKGEFWGFDALFSEITRRFAGENREVPIEPAYRAVDAVEIYSVPLAAVSRIPTVRWKLFEAFRKQHPYAAPRYRGTAR